MTKLKADVVLRCFRIVAAVTLLACGRCAPSIHDTHVPRRTTPLSRDNARLSFEVARPPFLIFYFGFEEIAEKFRRGVEQHHDADRQEDEEAGSGRALRLSPPASTPDPLERPTAVRIRGIRVRTDMGNCYEARRRQSRSHAPEDCPRHTPRAHGRRHRADCWRSAGWPSGRARGRRCGYAAGAAPAAATVTRLQAGSPPGARKRTTWPVSWRPRSLEQQGRDRSRGHFTPSGTAQGPELSILTLPRRRERKTGAQSSQSRSFRACSPCVGSGRSR